MKGNVLINCCFLSIFTFTAFSPSLSACPYQEHKPIKEEVTVTNVEVPVRVLYKGKPVKDLTKEDFTIYENKKKMDINGFFIKRRRINIDRPDLAGKSTGKTISLPPAHPRMFVLAFNVTSYNKYFQEAMDHLFDKILKPSDHVIVFANDTSRQYPRLENKSRIKQQIIRDLREESKKAKRRLLVYINRLEGYINAGHPLDNFRNFLTVEVTDVAKSAHSLIKFLKKYLIAWNEYKKRYLTPRVEHFYYFARYLEKVKAEKFVLNFYQFEFFPKIRLASQAMQKIREISNLLSNTDNAALVAQGHLINNLLNQLMSDYDLIKGFPNEEISKLFYKVDATFHSFFIKAAKPTIRDDFDYRTLSSDLENVLKSITDITGGKNITSNKLVDSLETVSEIEDVYYILTYAPHDPNKTGKLKIKVKNKKYKVLYDDNFRADYINEYLQKLEEKIKTPDIKIENVSFDRKILAFTVTDYLLKEKDETPIGRLKVRIRLEDKDNRSLFDQEKILTDRKSELTVSLSAFKRIKTGEYDFLIDAADLFTGKEASFHQTITVK
jgi:hypothetical protein